MRPVETHRRAGHEAAEPEEQPGAQRVPEHVGEARYAVGRRDLVDREEQAVEGTCEQEVGNRKRPDSRCAPRSGARPRFARVRHRLGVPVRCGALRPRR